jgi:hypothetical protein
MPIVDLSTAFSIPTSTSKSCITAFRYCLTNWMGQQQRFECDDQRDRHLLDIETEELHEAESHRQRHWYEQERL